MLTTEQRNVIDWKAAIIAGLSSAGVAVAPPAVLSTGAIRIVDNQFGAWEEASILDAYAENLDRFPRMLLGTFGSGSHIRLQDRVIRAEHIAARKPREEQSTTKSPSEWIAEIRSRLTLQIKEFAEIVGVERPTIYAWIKGNAAPQKHNQIRLRQLHRIAMAWSRLSKSPTGTALREVDDSGLSVIDYLMKDPIPEETILGKFRAIALTSVTAKAKQRQGLREFARERGMDLSNVADQSGIVDVTTGKRASME